MRQHRRAALAVLLLSQLMAVGCEWITEAEFNLAPDSRIPKWFAFPTCVSAYVCAVQYTIFSEGRVRVRIYGPDGSQVGEVRPVDEGTVWSPALGGVPAEDQSADKQTYPVYSVLSFNGVREVIEHRRGEPTFYLVDDPDLIARVVKALPPK